MISKCIQRQHNHLVMLLQLVLTVDIARVGTYAMLPNTKITPSSLIPLEGDVSENEELMKMSGLMIYVSLQTLMSTLKHAAHWMCLPDLSVCCVHQKAAVQNQFFVVALPFLAYLKTLQQHIW